MVLSGLNRENNGAVQTQDPSMVATDRLEPLQFHNEEFLADFEWALGNEYVVQSEAYGDTPWTTTWNAV